ncbi:hypothetical protein BIW16_03155 [Vibrio sp. OULL4]|nr:hypothetical protein BIW16_03155 [Vibrio sp. OULL4]
MKDKSQDLTNSLILSKLFAYCTHFMTKSMPLMSGVKPIGWINKENLPVINGRTTKVLRYFGFDVKQLSE